MPLNSKNETKTKMNLSLFSQCKLRFFSLARATGGKNGKLNFKQLYFASKLAM